METERIVELDDGSLRIALRTPVMEAGVCIESLDMRGPRVRDQLAASRFKGSDEEKEIRMMASLCEVSPAIIEELSIGDYLLLGEAYKRFLV